MESEGSPTQTSGLTNRNHIRQGLWIRLLYKLKSNTTQTDNVNVADGWRKRICTLTGEVSQAVSFTAVTTNCEKSAEVVVVEKLL